MTTTDSYKAVLHTMRDELATIDGRAKQLRSAIKAVEPLTGAMSPRRSSRSRDDSNVPEHLKNLSTKDRVHKVMLDEPQQEWTIETLAGATLTPNVNTMRSALHALVKGLIVESNGRGTWKLMSPQQTD